MAFEAAENAGTVDLRLGSSVRGLCLSVETSLVDAHCDSIYHRVYNKYEV